MNELIQCIPVPYLINNLGTPGNCQETDKTNPIQRQASEMKKMRGLEGGANIRAPTAKITTRIEMGKNIFHKLYFLRL